MCAAAATCSLLYLIIRRARMQLRNKERPAEEPLLVMSFGSVCLTASSLGAAHARMFAGPFDWIFTSPAIIAHVIADGGKTLLDREQCCKVNDDANLGRSHRTYSPMLTPRTAEDPRRQANRHGVIFNHHDPQQSDVDHAYLQRACARLRAALASPLPKLCVLISLERRSQVSDHELDKLLEVLEAHCHRESRVTLVAIKLTTALALSKRRSEAFKNAAAASASLPASSSTSSASASSFASTSSLAPASPSPTASPSAPTMPLGVSASPSAPTLPLGVGLLGARRREHSVRKATLRVIELNCRGGLAPSTLSLADADDRAELLRAAFENVPGAAFDETSGRLLHPALAVDPLARDQVVGADATAAPVHRRRSSQLQQPAQSTRAAPGAAKSGGRLSTARGAREEKFRDDHWLIAAAPRRKRR